MAKKTNKSQNSKEGLSSPSVQFSPRGISASSIGAINSASSPQPELQLKTVAFGEGWDITKDEGGAYIAPHWDASRAVKSYPYLYKASSPAPEP